MRVIYLIFIIFSLNLSLNNLYRSNLQILINLIIITHINFYFLYRKFNILILHFIINILFLIICYFLDLFPIYSFILKLI